MTPSDGGLRTVTSSLTPWRMRRLGIVLEPDPANPREAEGVLNPAITRGPDGQLYLLPRLVASGNFSRIGLARVLFNRKGEPSGVERMGVVLEPEMPYELTESGGGVEDPRVTYLPERHLYVMTYTAYGTAGPRIAAAISRDLVHWQRLGLVRFAPYHGIDMEAYDNKDALLFPELVPAPNGRPALALIHRPDFGELQQESTRNAFIPPRVRGRPSMWISYAAFDDILAYRHVRFDQHHLLASSAADWEQLKVGGGAPPIRVPDGWVVFYHGVSGQITEGIAQQQAVHYSAGALLLDAADPRNVLYRTSESILAPDVAEEIMGIVPNVVFPTGTDLHRDGTIDVYYGMADSRIGVAQASLTEIVPMQVVQAA
jgi:predicted GH43/DUF377 family glycosyl hydrolase